MRPERVYGLSRWHYKICPSFYLYSTIFKKIAFLYQRMIHFQKNWKYLLLCISELYLRANVAKYINTQMSLFCYFLHTCEQLERKFLLWLLHAHFLKKHFDMKIDI